MILKWSQKASSGALILLSGWPNVYHEQKHWDRIQLITSVEYSTASTLQMFIIQFGTMLYSCNMFHYRLRKHSDLFKLDNSVRLHPTRQVVLWLPLLFGGLCDYETKFVDGDFCAKHQRRNEIFRISVEWDDAIASRLPGLNLWLIIPGDPVTEVAGVPMNHRKTWPLDIFYLRWCFWLEPTASAGGLGTATVIDSKVRHSCRWKCTLSSVQCSRIH